MLGGRVRRIKALGRYVRATSLFRQGARGVARRAMIAGALLLLGGSPVTSAASIPPPAAGSEDEGDAGAARLAAQALDAGHAAEAAGILETLVAPRHHMLAILPEWHRDLARAYSALGLVDGAAGQYRLALSHLTDSEAGTIGKEVLALLAKVGTADIVPDTLGPNGAKYFDLHWVDRGHETIDFVTAFMMPRDDTDGVAFTTAIYRADCPARTTQLLGGAAFSSTGKKLRSFGQGEATRPANDLADHSLRMICRRDPALQVKRVPTVDSPELLARYRSQRAQRTGPASSAAMRGAHDAACHAHVEMFVGQLAAEGQVSGPSWQIRDWWSLRTEEFPAERLAAAKSAVAALARTDADAARAFQQACVKEALAGGAVPGV